MSGFSERAVSNNSVNEALCRYQPPNDYDDEEADEHGGRAHILGAPL